MIRVKIVQGVAIDVEELSIHEEFFSSWRRVIAFWDRLFIDKFKVIAAESGITSPMEGHEYWAWPCGNGKIYLMEQIGDENMIA